MTSPQRPFKLSDFDLHKDGPMLSIGDCCKILDLSLTTVTQLVSARDIRSVRFGRNKKIPWVSLREYLFRSKALPLTDRERKLLS